MSAEVEDIPPIYFKLHLKILFYLGIDIIPIKNNVRSFFFHLYSLFIIGLMCLYTVTEFLDMVLNFEDIYKMTFILCYFVTHILGTAKMFLMLVLRTKLWHHLQSLETGIFKPNVQRGGTKEIHLVKDGIKLCKRQGYFFYTFVIIIIGARIIYAALANLPYDKHNYLEGNITIIVNTKIMPYTTWMPFDYNDSPYYELVFVFQIFCTVIYGFYIGAADAVICGFLILIKAQFLILKRELETLIERATEAAESRDFKLTHRTELLDEKIQNRLAKLTNDCVFHHQELLALCDQSESDFCYLMLLQFISSLLIMCFQLFQLSTLSPNSVEFFSMMMYLILMLFQLLCYCWHGNEVQLVSGQISADAFNIDWIVLNKSVKNTLILMMMRSQRPNYFTAGKFSLLSLATFMTVGSIARSTFFILCYGSDTCQFCQLFVLFFRVSIRYFISKDDSICFLFAYKIVRGAGSYFMFLKQMNG